MKRWMECLSELFISDQLAAQITNIQPECDKLNILWKIVRKNKNTTGRLEEMCNYQAAQKET